MPAALGHALGTVHETFRHPTLRDHPRLSRLSCDVPWIMMVHRPRPELLASLSTANADTIRILQSHEGLVVRLDQLRDRWHQETLIHSDIKSDNILVWRSKQDTGTEIRIVDWEMVQRGDPAWDVAGALQDYIAFWVSSMPLLAEMPMEERVARAKYPLHMLHRSIRALWTGYRMATTLLPTNADALLQRRRILGCAHHSDRLRNLLSIAGSGPTIRHLTASGRQHSRGPGARPCSAFGDPDDVATMTIEMHADLFSMINAVEIRSPTQFTFRGAVRDIGVQTDRDNLQAAPGVVPLVSVLELDLYWKLYTKPTDPDAVPIADPMARRQLMAALSAANTGQGTWEPGWTIEHVDEHGHVSVRKNGIIFWVPEAGLHVRQGGLKPGQSCRVKVGKESRYWMPGYYVAIGNGVPDEDDATETVEPLVRYYWHLTQEAAVPLMAAATSLLNAAGVPFRLKVLADPGAYRRADAGVLYLNRADERRVGDIIVRIHQCIAAGLRPEVPMLTKQIALGLGLAEDPGGPLSFGQHRCKLAATAMWRSYVNGESERDRRAETLAAVFSEAGLRPDASLLGTGGG